MKYITIIIASLLGVAACSSDSKESTSVEDVAWELFSEEDQDRLCDVYQTTDKDQLISVLETETSSEQAAEAYYDTLVEECENV